MPESGVFYWIILPLLVANFRYSYLVLCFDLDLVYWLSGRILAKSRWLLNFIYERVIWKELCMCHRPSPQGGPRADNSK